MLKKRKVIWIVIHSFIMLAVVTGCGDSSTSRRQSGNPNIRKSPNGNSTFVNSIYATFKRQTDSFINTVRPEQNKSRKLQLWGTSTKAMANDLAAISAASVTDQKLLEMRQAIQSQAEHVASLMSAPDASDNFVSISREGDSLSEMQGAFDNYVKASGY